MDNDAMFSSPGPQFRPASRAFRPPSLQRLVAVSLALTAVLPALAQTLPNSGTLLDATRPAPSLPPSSTGVLPEAVARPALKLDDHVKIPVKAIRVTGAKAFSEAELQALVADAPGKEWTLAELNEFAQRITRHYHDAGFLLARAYLPAQDIKDGIVEIAVLEGRLGKLHIDNASRLAANDVAARLAALRENEALEGGALERSLLLLNDLPGVEVKSTLKPGASVGTTDLDIRVVGGSPYSGTVELDNYGNRYTGDLRLGGSLTAGNLAGLGESLSVRALTAEGMDYRRVAGQLPVGSQGTQAGAAYSTLRYKLGHDFASLKAHGTADIGNLYLLHPFLRSRIANLNGQLNYDHKELRDDVDSTATRSNKKVDVWTLGLSGDRTDGFFGGGLSNASASYTGGHLKLDAASLTLDQAGHRTAGNYGKANLNLSRLQSLGSLSDNLTLYGALQLQWAGKNLDSSEKLTLGGAQAVRAYPQGEAPSDDAWLANLELRYAFQPNWQASLFHDAADGRLNHRAIAADTVNHRHVAGWGLGLTYAQTRDLMVQTGLAWRENAKATSDVNRTPRVWVQAVKYF